MISAKVTPFLRWSMATTWAVLLPSRGELASLRLGGGGLDSGLSLRERALDALPNPRSGRGPILELLDRGPMRFSPIQKR
jgi:hypothetical protein